MVHSPSWNLLERLLRGRLLVSRAKKKGTSWKYEGTMLSTFSSYQRCSVWSTWSKNGQSTCTEVSLHGFITLPAIVESIVLLSKEGASRSDLVGLCTAGLGVGE